MSRSWNGKALVDSLATRLWNTSTTFRVRIIEWINEIMQDLAQEIPQEYFLFKLKKLLPTQQDIIDLSPEKPSAPTVALSDVTTTYTYNSSTQSSFTYNSSLITFGASSASLQPLIAGEFSLIKYYSDFNFTLSSGDNANDSSVGSPVITSNKLDLTTASQQYVGYPLTLLPSSLTDITISYKYTPNYTGTPSSRQYIITIMRTLDDAGSFVMYHDASSGDLAVQARSGSGATIASTSVSGWSPTSGTEYDLEFSMDQTNNKLYIHIDGVKTGGTGTFSESYTGSLATTIRVGGYRTSSTSNFSIRDVQIFGSVQNSDSTNFSGSIPRTVYKYSPNSPSIDVSSALSIVELNTFSESIATPTGTAVQYILNVDGQDKYWSGAAWVDSDGTYAQSNPASTINTNAEALLSDTVASDLILKALLNSNGFDKTPSITSTTLVDYGALINATQYKVYVTFLIYDMDSSKYIESMPSLASSTLTADIDNQTIDVSSIDTYDGDTTVQPNIVHRRIYVSMKGTSDTDFGEPFWLADIEDNTTTTYSIVEEPTSTVTPPSDTEIDQLSSKTMYFNDGTRHLTRQDLSEVKRFSITTSSSTSPDIFDYVDHTRIFLYPVLSSSATTAQRTLSYFILRRPHEIFYDQTIPVDLPIQAKKALIKGVEWLAYDYLDRDGKVSKMNEYEQYKKQFKMLMRRQKGRPSSVRDVNGDTKGWSI